MTWTEHDGARLYYQSLGEGPVITFAHGAGGNAASWFQQVPYFYPNYRTLVFDHRGFARSVCKPEDYHARHFAGDLAAILDHAEVRRTALVCQSLGGWTGIRFALRYPERVSCLVMSHTTGGITNRKIQDILQEAARTRQQPESPFGSLAIAADLPDRDPVRANLYNQIGHFNTTISLEQILAGIGDESSRTTPADLESFPVPVLFITASMDVLMPPGAVVEAARLIAGSEVTHFEGIGHSSYFECPDDFNEVVGGFIARHQGRQSVS